MKTSLSKTGIAAGTALLIACSTSGAFAQGVNVTLNGSPITLSPAPTQRAGRVFVPLRGVFEKLGASVVYQGGVINAQGNGRSVSLKIGSNQATVDGAPQTIDVAPFIIGASTYVPLRFVSQALGATVNYDGGNHVVALSTNGAPVANAPAEPAQTITPQPVAAKSALQLTNLHPGRGGTVESRRPVIEAQFTGAAADPNSVRIALDGLDITNQSSRSGAGFVFSPPSDLQSMAHQVRVTGKDTNGASFERGWQFTSGTSMVTNAITNLRPAEGASVPNQFTVAGRTAPGARVVVQVGAVAQATAENVLGQILGISTGGGGNTVRNEVTADANGDFASQINIGARAGQNLTLVVDSIEPKTQTAAPRQTRHLTVQ